MKSGSRFLIYLPARNSAQTVVNVLERIPLELRRAAAEILVVDNASTDGTCEIVQDYAGKNELTHLRIVRNGIDTGYGGSQKIGYRRGIELGVDAVAMLHADGQYAPESLPELLAPILADEFDMVFGSRITGDPHKGGMPWWRFVANRALTEAQNVVLGRRLSEYHSGYRIYSVKTLRELDFSRLADDFHFDSDIIIALVRLGKRIGERPIPTFYGPASSSASFTDCVRYGFGILRGLWRFKFTREI